MKCCTKCKLTKPLAEFRRQSSTKDGLKYTCRACDDATQKARYQRIKPQYIAKVKEWQKSNPDKVLGYKKKYDQKPEDEGQD